MNIVFVAIGGFIGAILRYLCSVWLGKFLQSGIFPWRILVVNCLGCFIFGLLYSVVEGQLMGLFFFTGVLGAFTTFSTFSVEAIQLWQKRLYMSFFLYLCLTLVGGTLLFTVGNLIL